MNPADWLLVILSIVFGGMALLAKGLTIHGLGPGTLALMGAAWYVWMQRKRHLSWLAHRDEGFSPGTQHLVLLAIFGWAGALFAAVTWAFLALPKSAP